MVGETEGARTETGNKEGKTSTVTSHLHSPATHTHTHTHEHQHTHTHSQRRSGLHYRKRKKNFSPETLTRPANMLRSSEQEAEAAAQTLRWAEAEHRSPISSSARPSTVGKQTGSDGAARPAGAVLTPGPQTNTRAESAGRSGGARKLTSVWITHRPPPPPVPPFKRTNFAAAAQLESRAEPRSVRCSASAAQAQQLVIPLLIKQPGILALLSTLDAGSDF